VLNKIDIKRPEDLTEEQKAAIQEVVNDNPGAGETSVAHMSTKTEEGVMALKDLVLFFFFFFIPLLTLLLFLGM